MGPGIRLQWCLPLLLAARGALGLNLLQIPPEGAMPRDAVTSMAVSLDGTPGSQQMLHIRGGQTPVQAATEFCQRAGVRRPPGMDAQDCIAHLSEHVQHELAAQPKIIDAFQYNGEPILELRLKLLYDLVDEFVLVEATRTFSGKPKPVLFSERHAAMLAQYSDKLTIMVVDFPEPTAEDIAELSQRYYTNEGSVESWFREHYQRDVIARYVTERYAGRPYVLVTCDVDEIPKRHILQQLRNSATLYRQLDTPTTLEMAMFFYNFRWRRNHTWLFAYVINDEGVRRINGQLSFARQHPQQYIPDAGWHGSYFFSGTDIVRKLDSFAHTEFSGDAYKDLAKIRRCLRDGCNILSRDANDMEGMIAFDVAQLPPELQEFQSKLTFLQDLA